MSGFIRIDENRAWSTAGWAFDHVLRVTRPHLLEAESSKLLELIDRVTITEVYYMSLKDLTSNEMQTLREAFEKGYQDMVTRGPESFADPTFYPGFMESFRELLEEMPKITNSGESQS